MAWSTFPISGLCFRISGNSGGSLCRLPTIFSQPAELGPFIDSGRVLGLFQQGSMRPALGGMLPSRAELYTLAVSA